MKLTAALCIISLQIAFPALADDRVKNATDVILQLCIASGQTVEITKKENSIEVAGGGRSLQIDRRESSGLVGGISKEITALSAQQASEARSCTQKYLTQLVNVILNDEKAQTAVRTTVNNEASSSTNPEVFWGGRGVWQDNQNYCNGLLELLTAAAEPENFRFVNNQLISLDAVTETVKHIVGNYFVRTEPGSSERFCIVHKNQAAPGGAYYALACSRAISSRREIFASVFNQTLKDMRDCLLPAGWKQTTLDQGACIPIGNTRGECVRRFSKGYRNAWLFSNLEKDSNYTMGIQTQLGKVAGE